MPTAASKAPEPSVSMHTPPDPCSFITFSLTSDVPTYFIRLALLVPPCVVVWFRVVVNILHMKTQV